MSRAKILLKQYLEDLEAGRAPLWSRKTQFIEQEDGSVRRLVTLPDGSVEKDETIPAERWRVFRARGNTGLSQAEFAKLLGVSKRTLQEWEQGRKQPSGAARTLIAIAEQRPEVLRELRL